MNPKSPADCEIHSCATKTCGLSLFLSYFEPILNLFLKCTYLELDQTVIDVKSGSKWEITTLKVLI